MVFVMKIFAVVPRRFVTKIVCVSVPLTATGLGELMIEKGSCPSARGQNNPAPSSRRSNLHEIERPFMITPHFCGSVRGRLYATPTGGARISCFGLERAAGVGN